MFHSSKALLIVLALGLVSFCATATAKADPLTLTLTQQTYTVTPGAKIIFAGTLTNPNADGFSIAGQGLRAPGGPTGLFWVFAGWGPTPDQQMPMFVDAFSSISGNLFEFDIKPDAELGTYFGDFYLNVFPGEIFDPNLNERVASSIVINVVPAEVREPASLFLLGTGLAASVGIYRRLKQRRIQL
jgi:hypothetical protein